VHLQTSLVQSFVLLFQNFEEVVQIIALNRFGGAPHYNQLAPLARLDKYFNEPSNYFYSFLLTSWFGSKLESSNFNIVIELSKLSRAIESMLNFPKCSPCVTNFMYLQLYNYYFKKITYAHMLISNLHTTRKPNEIARATMSQAEPTFCLFC
jgi:hypothetical protein